MLLLSLLSLLLFFLDSVTDIAQWAVLAIRNLCEANPANQQLIAGLRAQGVCPIDQDVLKAAGGELEVGEDGRVRIKQSKSK